MQRVAIIDYGSGNLHSAAKAFERAARESELSVRVAVTANPDDVAAADRIVLPGVGAFADCRNGLDAVAGMQAAMEKAVREQGRPFLGICVGMQLLAERGLEFRTTPGLGWIKGDVQAILTPGAGVEDPAHGLEYHRCGQASPAVGGYSQLGPSGYTPISCIHSIL